MSTSTALKPIEAKSYGYFSALYRSFYSSNLYVDVGKRWRGLGLLYLFLMIAVFSLPLQYKSIVKMNAIVDELVDDFKQIPTVVIKEGIISFDKPMPYEIKDKQGQVKIVIDTTGEIKNIDTKKYPKMNILLTRNTLVYKIPRFSVFDLLGTSAQQKQDIIMKEVLPPEMTQLFNGKEWVEYETFEKIKMFGWTIIPIGITFLSWSFFIVLLMCFALFGQIVARGFFDFKASYKQACRLMMVASSPMVLLIVAMNTVGIKIPFSGFISIGILAFYFCFGIIALKIDSRKLAVV